MNFSSFLKPNYLSSKIAFIQSVCWDSFMSEGSLQLESCLLYPSKFDFHLNCWLSCSYFFNMSTSFLFILSFLCNAAQNGDFFFYFIFALRWKNTFHLLYKIHWHWLIFYIAFEKYPKIVYAVRGHTCNTNSKHRICWMPPNMLPDLLYSAVLLFLFHALHYISYLVSLEGVKSFQSHCSSPDVCIHLLFFLISLSVLI